MPNPRMISCLAGTLSCHILFQGNACYMSTSRSSRASLKQDLTIAANNVEPGFAFDHPLGEQTENL